MWIIAVFLIARAFFNLAKKNGKTPLPFVVAGIVTYTFADTIIGYIVGLVLEEYTYNWWFSLISVALSLVAVSIVYLYLKSSWQPKTRSKHKKKYDNRVTKSPTVSPTPTVSSKINPERPGPFEPPRSMSSQSVGRYNKNER